MPPLAAVCALRVLRVCMLGVCGVIEELSAPAPVLQGHTADVATGVRSEAMPVVPALHTRKTSGELSGRIMILVAQ